MYEGLKALEGQKTFNQPKARFPSSGVYSAEKSGMQRVEYIQYLTKVL